MSVMIKLGLVISALLAALPAAAQGSPTAYDATTAWWSRHTRAIETGAPAVGFALPVMRDDRMIAALTIACPKGAGRGAFLEVPKAVLPLGQLDGKEVGTIVAINGEAFAGFVDRDRSLVYFDGPSLPRDIPGLKIGTSVRAALTSANGTLRISTDTQPHTGIIIKPTRAETSSPGAAELIRNLRGQGLAPVGLSQAIRTCDAFMQGKS